MSQTLSEIVSAALRQADVSTKVASLRDAPIQDRGFARVDDYLARELGQVEVEQGAVKQAAAEQPHHNLAEGLDDVQLALKLAEALDHGVYVVQKLAGPLNKSDGGAPTPGAAPLTGPAPIFEQPYERASTITPRPQASAHARAAQANDTLVDGAPQNDAAMQLNDGPVIPSNYPTSRVPTTGAMSKKANRDAAQRLLNSKIAQHKMLVSLGQIESANAIMKEAEEIAAGSDLVFKDNYGAASFPDNEGVRALTKAQARDRNQREAGAFFNEPVKRDNAVAAHTAVTTGLKLSHDRAGLILRAGLMRKSAAGVGDTVKWVGEKGINAARRALTGARAGAVGTFPELTQGASDGVRGTVSTHVGKAINSLTNASDTAKMWTGGSMLGAGALGAGGLGYKALKGGKGDRR